MSARRLHILGTSAQVPVRDRNHPGFFLKWDNEGILFDPGEGTQRQMHVFGITTSSITKIFISHFHGDHCLGLPGVIQRLALDGVEHPVKIFFPSGGEFFYRNLVSASEYHNEVELDPCPVTSQGLVFEDERIRCFASPLDHPSETYGYRIEEKDGITLLPDRLKAEGITGSRVKEILEKKSLDINGKNVKLANVSKPKKGQCMVFMMDTRLNPTLFKLARDADMLLSEGTYTTEHRQLAQIYGHLTSAQAAEVASQSGVNQLILAHFSQRYSDTIQLLQEAKAVHPESFAASDGDVFNFPRRQRGI